MRRDRAILVGVGVGAIAVALLVLWTRPSDRDEALPRRAVESKRSASRSSRSALDAPPDERAAARADPNASEVPSAMLVLDQFRVHGRVLDSDSRAPVSGASVELHDRTGTIVAREVALADGTFAIEVLGGVRGSFGLVASHHDYAPSWTEGDGGAKVDWPVELALTRASVIAGTVVTRDGAPIAGAEIQVASLVPTFEEEWVDAISDDAGRFAVTVASLPREGLWLAAHADGFASDVLDLNEVARSGPPSDLTVRLARRAVVHGRVIDATTLAPIVSASVRVMSSLDAFAEFGGATLTDANGNFEVDLAGVPATLARLYIRARGYGPSLSSSVAKHVGANDSPLIVELGSPATVRGRVRASDGGEASGMVVASRSRLAEAYAFECSDAASIRADGTFEIELSSVPRGGAVIVLAEVEGCMPERATVLVPQLGDDRLVSRAGPIADAPAVDLIVERALTVGGRVVDSATAKPRARVRVRALTRAGATDAVETDHDGEYELQIAARDAAGARLAVEAAGRRFDAGPIGEFEGYAITRDLAIDLGAAAAGR